MPIKRREKQKHRMAQITAEGQREALLADKDREIFKSVTRTTEIWEPGPSYVRIAVVIIKSKMEGGSHP